MTRPGSFHPGSHSACVTSDPLLSVLKQPIGARCQSAAAELPLGCCGRSHQDVSIGSTQEPPHGVVRAGTRVVEQLCGAHVLLGRGRIHTFESHTRWTLCACLVALASGKRIMLPSAWHVRMPDELLNLRELSLRYKTPLHASLHVRPSQLAKSLLAVVRSIMTAGADASSPRESSPRSLSVPDGHRESPWSHLSLATLRFRKSSWAQRRRAALSLVPGRPAQTACRPGRVRLCTFRRGPAAGWPPIAACSSASRTTSTSAWQPRTPGCRPTPPPGAASASQQVITAVRLPTRVAPDANKAKHCICSSGHESIVRRHPGAHVVAGGRTSVHVASLATVTSAARVDTNRRSCHSLAHRLIIKLSQMRRCEPLR